MANKQPEPAVPVASLEHENSPLERMVEENLKTILIVGGVIFLAVIGYLVFNYARESTAATEAVAFTRATSIDEYGQVISDFPGTLTAGNAQLMIAKLRKKEEDGAEEAKGALRTFLETYKDHPQRDQALFTLAGMFIEEGDTAEATGHLDSLIQEHADSPLAGFAKLYKGDFAFEAGSTEEAEQIYDSVMTDFTGASAEMAAQRLDLVKVDKPVTIAPRETPAEPEDAEAVIPPEISRPSGADAEGAAEAPAVEEGSTSTEGEPETTPPAEGGGGSEG